MDFEIGKGWHWFGKLKDRLEGVKSLERQKEKREVVGTQLSNVQERDDFRIRLKKMEKELRYYSDDLGQREVSK